MLAKEARSTLQLQLQELGVTDEGLLTLLSDAARIKEVERGEIIIKTGEQPTHFFMILSGLARYYYLAHDGKEWNKAFFREGQLIGSLSAFLTHQPCTYTISAMEKCQLAVIPTSLFEQGTEIHPQLDRLLNSYVQLIMLRNEAREAMLLTCNSEAHYRWLMTNQEWLVRRVPQYQLASYLGVEPASLSRIKRQLGLPDS
ncbi:Crp/Fnr family transcriptional regulator [Pseudomonas sp. Gutcm_11s]|uniref:Crp/Fnr family transcriptional regulator n=1 Tax=Pseudomonas sp. Gutcm_11s TaxID=3026088 RepID=UPI00235E2EC4|nr:Crp/Fnr family transcriptional regulator [Pseudomonas sp. Gutcm_11s]MDD0841453.1 Crp/Fnr family transcriptional regulator [Pseudomonas sp. Gutcm_11s]